MSISVVYPFVGLRSICRIWSEVHNFHYFHLINFISGETVSSFTMASNEYPASIHDGRKDIPIYDSWVL